MRTDKIPENVGTLSLEQVELMVSNSHHRYARQVWNAAIEKCAMTADKEMASRAAARIRELKK